MFELPPRLLGDEQTQLVALRDYLVRLATSLEPAIDAAAVTALKTIPSAPARTGTGQRAADSASREEKRRYNELRSLIVKTADVVEHEIDVLTTELRENYVARSDFGTYQESAAARFTETARGVEENYTLLRQLSDTTASLEKTMRGQIRRGWLDDPDRPGDKILGIAVSENLHVLEGQGNEYSDGGLTYYRIPEGQRFGMYTSRGWQFWVDGTRIGWFNSDDRMLHVPQIAVESGIQLGDGWIFTAANGLGLRKLG